MPLDEIDEQVLVLTKEYNIPYLTLMDDTTYTDIGVLYAKVANSKAFEAYSQYISLDAVSYTHLTLPTILLV